MVPHAPGCGLGSGKNLGEERVEYVVDEHGDKLRRPLSSGKSGFNSQGLHGLENPLFELGAHRAGTVEDMGYRGDGNTSSLGDFLQGSHLFPSLAIF